MRVLTTLTRTAVEQRQTRWTVLVSAGFPSGGVYFTTSPMTIQYGGQEWLGGGRMLGIKIPREDGSLAAHKGEMHLDGLDGAAISLAFNERTENTVVHCDMLVFDKESGVPQGTIKLGRYTVSEVRVIPPTSAQQGGFN